MAVQIVTDTACDLTVAEAEALGVHMVPLHVTVAGQEYVDRYELSPTQFYQKMEGAPLPRTAAPGPERFAEAYRAAAAKGPVLGIHLSSGLSGTVQSALLGARSLEEGAVSIFDSLTGSMGQALLVLQALDLSRLGATVNEIVEALRLRRAQMNLYCILDTLENAVKGGRVNRWVGRAASLLNLKPIVHVTQEGKVEQHGQVRGRRNALLYVLDQMAKETRDWASLRVGVAHADCLEDAQKLIAMIKERFNPAEVILGEIGAVIGTYSARGGLVVAF